jgi:type IV secretion system protein VirB9
MIMLLALWSSHAWCDSTPVRSTSDVRVGFVDYKADDVIVIAVSMGVITRIILGSDEQIIRADAGFTSDCESTTPEWCVRAESGSNQITVKPRRGATRNNLEVSTTKRDYSFALVTREGAENAKGVFYRVLIRYPLELPSAHVSLVPPQAINQIEHNGPGALGGETSKSPGGKSAPKEGDRAYARPQIKNLAYAIKSDERSKEILPSAVFDDGRYTYFKFPKAREVPSVFATDADGEEIRVSTHSQRLLADAENPGQVVEDDWLVVRRMSRAFRLRLGALVAEVINKDFDPDGVETLNGTTVPGLVREDKGEMR